MVALALGTDFLTTQKNIKKQKKKNRASENLWWQMLLWEEVNDYRKKSCDLLVGIQIQDFDHLFFAFPYIW